MAVLLLVALSLAGCATRRPTVVPEPTPGPVVPDVGAMIGRGCFHCLDEALAVARHHGLGQHAFEAAVLLALRARELGMPDEALFEQARALAPGAADSTLHLEIAAAMPRDPLSGARDDLLLQDRARESARSVAPRWREALIAGGASPAFRGYLDLSLVCSVAPPGGAGEAARLATALPDVPLLQYRIGICGAGQREQLAAVRAGDADFVDADYALGRYALGGETPNQEEALRLLRSAAAAFPTSTAMHVTIGNLLQSWEDWAGALAAYDAALGVLAGHPNALIGRTVSLSHLGRHEEAIATATALIDARVRFLGEAYYWRSWNHFNLERYHVARLDADRTRSLMVNAAVFVLSGMIEWRLMRLDSAEREFEQALVMDFGQCEAALMLGAVRAERTKVPEAISALQQARQCFDLSIAVRRRAIEAVNEGPGTPESKAREISRHQRAIAQAEMRRDEAAKAIARLT